MTKIVLALTLTLTVFVTLTLCENLQSWSQQAEEGKDFTIDCSPTNMDREPQPSAETTVLWYRHGAPDDKLTNSSFPNRMFLSNDDFRLTFTPVTSDLAGIYLCHVFNGSRDLGIVVKGLNIGGPKYSNLMDKYRTNIITGAITGGAVMFLVLSVCFIDHFRYLSPDQKEERRNRKQLRLSTHSGSKTSGDSPSGMDNLALDTKEENGVAVEAVDPNVEDKTAM